MFESLASCFAFRCSASLNMTDDRHTPNLKRYTHTAQRADFIIPSTARKPSFLDAASF